MIQNGIELILKQHKIIPVATINNEDDLNRILNCLLQKKIFIIEITLRTEFAWEAIERFKAINNKQFTVGVGTVIYPHQIEKLKELQVDFMVSPGATKQHINLLKNSGIPFLPGVSTVSEIMFALENDCKFLKFFPADLFGGSKAISVYEQLFPEIKFCPTGGINENTINEYQLLKNVLSIGGSWMIK